MHLLLSTPPQWGVRKFKTEWRNREPRGSDHQDPTKRQYLRVPTFFSSELSHWGNNPHGRQDSATHCQGVPGRQAQGGEQLGGL